MPDHNLLIVMASFLAGLWVAVGQTCWDVRKLQRKVASLEAERERRQSNP